MVYRLHCEIPVKVRRAVWLDEAGVTFDHADGASEGETVYPLANDRQGVVLTTGFTARITKRLRHPLGQTQDPVGLTQQQYAAVGSDGAAGMRS